MSEKYASDKKHGDSKWAVLKEKWTALKQAERAEEMKKCREASSVHRGNDNHLNLSVIGFLSFISVCFPESKIKKYTCKCR